MPEPPAAAVGPVWARRLWPWPAALALFALALVIRLHFQSHVTYEVYGDAIAFDGAAQRLLTAGEYGEPPWRAFRPPGYSTFLAGVYAVTGAEPAHVQRMQALVDALACVGLAWLGTGMFGRPAGVLTGLFAAVHKVLVEMTEELLSEALFYPLSVVLLLVLWFGRGRAQWWLPVAAGLCGALMQITRTQLLVAWPGLLAWAWFAWRPAWPNPRRRALVLALVLGVSLSLPMMWRYRNSRLFDGQFSGIATISWSNLYWGNIGINQFNAFYEDYRAMPWPEGELGLMNHSRDELLGRIRSDPPAYARFVLARLRYNIPRYFFWRELWGPHDVFRYMPPWVMSVRHLGVFTLVGAVVCWRRANAAALLFLYTVPQMTLYLLFSNAGHRFSWTLTGIFCLLAAVGLGELARGVVALSRARRPASPSASPAGEAAP